MRATHLQAWKKIELKEGEDFESLVAEVKNSLNFSFNSLEEVVTISLRKEEVKRFPSKVIHLELMLNVQNQC